MENTKIERVSQEKKYRFLRSGIKALKGGRFLKGVLFAVFVALLLVSAYYYHQYDKVRNNPDTLRQEENVVLITRLGNIMELPKDEVPVIGTVSDKEKLENKDFFRNAENGDKILIYSESRMAILFRPDSGKIIRVAPLTSDKDEGLQQEGQSKDNENMATPAAVPAGQSSAPPQEAARSESLSVVIENGTDIAGLAKDTQSMLSGIEGIDIVAVRQAAMSDYDKTLVIDITGRDAVKKEEIIRKINGEEAPLPVGELVPEGTDVLVIVGRGL